MDRGRTSIQLLWYPLILMFLMTIGCGGGGGGGTAAPASPAATISGVAAAGAPIIGTVTLKDSKGVERISVIAANGAYSIDVTGLTPPFALRADGNVGGMEYHLYSAAVSADINGTINITPFTDLIIANMAEQIAENYYEGGDFSGLTPEELALAQAALRDKLLPILTALGVADTIDLLRTSFNTNHTGLDAVIDVVKVTVDPGTVEATLTNVVNGESITVDIENGGTSTGTFTGDGVGDGVTAFQEIINGFNTFAALFATSLPSPENSTLLSLLDADTFLDNGEDLDTWLTDITTDNTMIGINLANFVLHSIDMDAGTAEVTFTVMQNGQLAEGPEGLCRMIKDGTWRYAGNGRIAHVKVRARADYWPYNIPTPRILTGLNLSIEASQPAGAEVETAHVTGPGLPLSGVTLTRQIAYEWFTLGGDTGNFYFITDDAAIGDIPENAEYTIELKDASDEVLATYKDTIPKRPLQSTELSSASFPVITAPTVAALEAFSGGSLTVTWTLPAGLKSEYLELQLADELWTETARVGADFSGAERSKTLTITAPAFTVINRNIWLQAQDAYAREFCTSMW